MAMNDIDMTVALGPLGLSSPIVTASGAFGYGMEYFGAVDYSKLGAVTAKGICMEPWPGNPLPRHAEVPGGIVNAIGLQGTGVKHFLERTLPFYEIKVLRPLGRKLPLIANIWGRSVAEYADVASAMSTDRKGIVSALEMNVSCPNVKAGGHTFGQDPDVLFEVVSAVRKATALPLLVKLAPNVPSMAPYAKACEEAGADALSMINTIPAMVIDVERRKPVLANVTGGLSGRAVHPVAVKAVYDARKATALPILAMGGVYSARDAIEFLLAGADAVSVGSAMFTDPSAVAKIHDGISDYCRRNGFGAVGQLKGALES
jgi:dihydroorotate dehydrogenase (NAD+) catalytic subunit